MSNLNLLELRMIDVIKAGPIRSKELFRAVNINDTAGGNTLSNLIEKQLVGIKEPEWTLYLK